MIYRTSLIYWPCYYTPAAVKLQGAGIDFMGLICVLKRAGLSAVRDGDLSALDFAAKLNQPAAQQPDL